MLLCVVCDDTSRRIRLSGVEDGKFVSKEVELVKPTPAVECMGAPLLSTTNPRSSNALLFRCFDASCTPFSLVPPCPRNSPPCTSSGWLLSLRALAGKFLSNVVTSVNTSPASVSKNNTRRVVAVAVEGVRTLFVMVVVEVVVLLLEPDWPLE